MLITEAQIGMRNNSLDILDKMNYLTEAESVYAPAMVPIVENSFLQANVVRLEDMIAFGEANGIEDLGVALSMVCEAADQVDPSTDPVDPSTIVFSVQETSLIGNDEIAQLASDIMSEGCAIVGVPISSHNPMALLAEAAINYAVENNNDYLIEAYENLNFQAFCEEETGGAAATAETGANPQGIVSKVLAKIKSAPGAAKDLIVNGLASLKEALRKVMEKEEDAGEDKKGFFAGLKNRIMQAIETLKNKLKELRGGSNEGAAQA